LLYGDGLQLAEKRQMEAEPAGFSFHRKGRRRRAGVSIYHESGLLMLAAAHLAREFIFISPGAFQMS
jgi:hypothetical protein